MPAAVVENPVPVIVTLAPAAAISGDTAVTVGAGTDVNTVNVCVLVAVLPAVVTVMVPLVTPEGAVATSRVADADVTVAEVPLNFTAFDDVVVENPVPLMVTAAPAAARLGSMPLTVTVPAADLATDCGLPLSS
ncbi:hypothetical protein Acsp01_54040 [Actinoplanes sp. NBRC 101535]|nr:hypothetical protein Acsp01_54040 [Actinoplanes sp. NBRC 101535]